MTAPLITALVADDAVIKALSALLIELYRDRLELALYCLHNKIIQSDADEESVAQKVVGR